MSARLFCRHGALSGLDFEIEGELTVGRGSDNTVVIDSGAVSSRHARITRDENRGCYVLVDLDSMNGTELDGERVTSETLGRLHVISFGQSGDFVFVDRSLGGAGVEAARDDAAKVPALDAPLARSPEKGESVDQEGAPAGSETMHDQELPALPSRFAQPDPEGPESQSLLEGTQASADAISLPPALAGPSAGPKAPDGTVISDDVLGLPPALLGDRPAVPEPAEGWFFEVVVADSPPQRAPLPLGEASVGRGKASAVQIAHDGLSRRHALLKVSADSVRIRDLGSTNGTFVDGTRLQNDEERVLEAGTTVHFGEIAATLRRGSVD